ncbi:MAG TPA: hypothetical protein VHY91_14105 [Pirellulales bacterium]|nr:hypothetical protein [Pirellulales bacterium]
MRKLRIPLRIVFYQDEGEWIAHCLEFDLLGDGPTKDEAARQLEKAIATQFESFLENKDINNLFSPAPAEIQRMFAEGDDEPSGMLKIDPIDNAVEFDDICSRTVRAQAGIYSN